MTTSETTSERPPDTDILAILCPTTTFAVWFGLYAAAGLAACFVPLFNRVGYESAVLFGAISGFVVPFLTLHSLDIASGQLSDAHPHGDLRAFGRQFIRNLALLGGPVGLLAANALRVQNCDFATGFAFWLSIPVVTTFLGQTLGWCAMRIPVGGKWVKNSLMTLFILGTIGWFGWRLAMQPPITGHQWMIGYFSGSIYDEALSHPWSLVYYRVLNLAVAGAALALVAGISRLRRGSETQRPEHPHLGWSLFLGALLVASVSGLWMYAPQNGVGITRTYIQHKLGGRIETEHFVIHHPETERFLERRDALAADHEFRYREMKRFFETDPAANDKIHSYVYPNRDQKGALMGGRRTLVAKIWLKEMHILWPRYGDHMLAHELAHVFTHPFGSGPLRLSADWWIGVNMGLVEGIATAADWPVDEMNPHQASAALRQINLAPNLRNIISAGGFWTTASRRAYTLTGSFLRFLRDQYGIEKVKRAYGTGDFESAFGKSADTLIGEWESFLSEVELDDGTLELARYLYRRPSIFGKVCPRTIGELRRRARVAAARGDVSEAKRLYDRVVGFAPENIDYQLKYARLLVQADAIEEAVNRLLEIRRNRKLAAVHRAELLELLGDARWHLRDITSARDAYRGCLERRLPAGKERLNRVKLASLAPERENIRPLAFQYLVEGADQGVASYFPMEWYRRRPTDAIAAYLVGRRLWANRLWRDASWYLETSVDIGLPRELSSEARRIWARSLYFDGRLSKARVIFEKLRDAPRAAFRVEAREWLSRIEFRADRDVP